MNMINMRWKVILLLILGISANFGLPIPPTRMGKPIRISPATMTTIGQEVKDASTGHIEVSPVWETANAHETGAKPKGLKYSTASGTYRVRFINALPTLPSFPTTQAISQSPNGLPRPHPLFTGTNPTGHKDERKHGSTVDRGYRIDVYYHHHNGASRRVSSAATTAIETTVRGPDKHVQESTTEAVPSTTIAKDEQYDYIVSYDELQQAIKKSKYPRISKKGTPFPLRDLLLAVFNSGRTKQEERVSEVTKSTENTTPMNKALPAHYHLMSERRPQGETSTSANYPRYSFL